MWTSHVRTNRGDRAPVESMVLEVVVDVVEAVMTLLLLLLLVVDLILAMFFSVSIAVILKSNETPSHCFFIVMMRAFLLSSVAMKEILTIVVED